MNKSPNTARQIRNCRRRAFKRLPDADKNNIVVSMQDLERVGLAPMEAFDILSTIGEWLVKKEVEL
jgi:vancomycin resistance protein YoaR